MNFTSKKALYIYLSIAVLGIFIFILYQNVTLRGENKTLYTEIDVLNREYASTTEQLSITIGSLQTELEETLGDNSAKARQLRDTISVLESVQQNFNNTKDELEDEKKKTGNFEEQIGKITDVVNQLDKLSKTDEELLQKYSRVYFLNEHYIPAALEKIDFRYIYNESKTYYAHSQMLLFLHAMLGVANENDIDIFVISAYRSFYTQSAVKSSYLVTYGEGANKFSADQGYSEHQLGTTVDFTTTSVGETFTGFEDTAAFTWLLNNAHIYGFILSYPESNDYYQFEPWHWRFVGVDLAVKLYEDGANFYDLDQRDINNYLTSIFN